MHRMFAAYALVSSLSLFGVHRGPGWAMMLGLHVLVAFLVLGLPPFARPVAAIGGRWPRLAGMAADWYPLLLIPVLYTELAALNQAVWGGHYFDGMILGWEAAIFGGQPSRELAVALPYLVLSELLHAAYLSYYLIIFGPPLYLYLRGRTADFHLAAFTVMLTFFVHYLFFIFLPVQGPRYLFPPPDGVIAEGYLFEVTHRVLEAGSSQGAAFPSSHVGVSFAQTFVVLRTIPALFVPLLVLSTGLALGAVYGGFHYATDALAGLVLGLGLAVLAPKVRRWFS